VEGSGECAVRPVFEYGMFRLELIFALVVPLYLVARIGKGFEQRDPAVLIRVGAIVRERLDEELAEVRTFCLACAPCRCHHDPTVCGQGRREPSARTRRVYDGDGSGRKRVQPCAQLCSGEIGTGEVQFGAVRSGRSVADQHDQHAVIGSSPPSERGDLLLEFLTRTAGCDLSGRP